MHFHSCVKFFQTRMLSVRTFQQLSLSYLNRFSLAGVVIIIPIPLPQHQHTFCQRRRFDQDCPGLRPDEDQGNPGRNVVSDKKCAGAEGEELVLLIIIVNLYQQSRVKCHHKDLTSKWLHCWAGKMHSTRLALRAGMAFLTQTQEMTRGHVHWLRRLFQFVKEMALGATFQSVQVWISLPNCTLFKLFASRLSLPGTNASSLEWVINNIPYCYYYLRIQNFAIWGLRRFCG